MENNNSSKHTQGEWKKERLPQLSGSIDIYSIGNTATICRCLCNDLSEPEMQANAEYICRAVNNHDSLVNALKVLVERVSIYGAFADTEDYNGMALKAAKEALQKIKEK